MEPLDLAERARSGARAGFLWVAAVYAGVAALYALAPPIEPAWVYSGISLVAALSFALSWRIVGRAPVRAVHPIILAVTLIAVAYALAFVALTRNPEQTTTLLITLLAAGCVLIQPWLMAIVSIVGTTGWLALVPRLAEPPEPHWLVDLVSTAVIATIVTVVRRRTFQRLEQLNRENGLLLDAAGEGIYGVDHAGCVTFANPATERILGRPASELIRRSEHATLHWEPDGARSYPQASCPFCHRERDGTAAPLPARRPNGEVAWVELTRKEVKHAHHLHTVVTLRDVTEQTSIQRALRDSEERNRLIVDTALDAVVSVDGRARIVGWNAQAERIFGWSREEILGAPLLETIVPPDLHERFVAESEKFQATGRGHGVGARIESRALRRNGQEFPVEFSVSPIRRCLGVTFTAFVRDITERVEGERILREAKEAAEAAAHAKSDFLATISHEIRTPLNGIFGMTELALDTRDDHERQDFLVRARAAAYGLMTVLNDVLDFSKIEAGRLPLESIEFDPETLLEGVLDTLAAEAQRKGLELIGCVDESVPPTLVGDPGRLRQILVNLGGNAIKFTERGEVLIRLALEAGSSGSATRLVGTVRDTGIGIPREQRARIFEAFTQVDSSTTRQYGGTGLGLTIVQRLVERMGGRVEVDSTPGRGSTFRFGVDLRRGEADAAEPGPRLGALRVLVVDDNEASARHLAHTLRGFGAHVDAVRDGTSACTRLNQAVREGSPYALVVLDLAMPDPDGATTARWIRGSSRGADVPLVLMNPLLGGPVPDLARLGVHTMVTKPIKRRLLRAAVLSALRRAPYRDTGMGTLLALPSRARTGGRRS
ncbi:MAG: PAS domain S-box protein [Deltaproteobacteria bacterium]|nr:PAS domain S-box protein [Deltaproteobacteria bacterium]